MELVKKLTSNPMEKPTDENNLGFGQRFTDHMLLMDHSQDKGWHDARIVPYGPIEFDLSTMVLHYGQEVFEGMKAYKTVKGETVLFRPEANLARLNASNDRLCIPRIDEKQALEHLAELIRIESDWVPKSEGTSLYIRPAIIATDAFLGVKASSSYLYFVILSPSGAYYKNGLQPVRIYVEDELVRAVKGGMGFAKTGGNYAASILAGERAHEKGYDQVLWLDGVHRRYVEEVGSMNIFFKIGGEIVTPELNGSVLPGITRDSVLTLAKDMGYKVSERQISIDEVFDAHAAGKLEEVFGTGTAAVISAVSELTWHERTIVVNDGKMGDFSRLMYDTITGIQYGTIEDRFGWIYRV
ncbi:MAG: branched-chain amino acid aminotransferase [Christensenellales bacterium]